MKNDQKVGSFGGFWGGFKGLGGATLTHSRPRWRGVRGAGTIFFLSQKLTILALTQRPGSAATIAEAYRTPTTKDIIFLVGCT